MGEPNKNIDFTNVKTVNFRKLDKDYFAEFEQSLEIESLERENEKVFVESREKGPTTLYVKVIEARDIYFESGAANVEVIVRLNYLSHTIKSEKQSVCPKFNDEFEFDVDRTIFNELEVEVYTNGVLMGGVYVNLGKADLNGELGLISRPTWMEIVSPYFNPSSHGEVCLQISRTGIKIPDLPPLRTRKFGVFDLELSSKDSDNILEDNFREININLKEKN